MIRLALLSLLLLVSCSDLEPEMVKKTITVTFSTSGFQQSSPANARTTHATSAVTSTINTELILLADDSVEWNQWYWSAFEMDESVYDGNFSNLSNDTVTLVVPLNTKLKLFVYRFQEYVGYQDIPNSENLVDEFGVSSAFYIDSEEQRDEMTIDVNLFTLNVVVEEEDTEEEVVTEEEEQEEEEVVIEEEEEVEEITYDVYDYDGNGYDTVIWNNRTWLKTNLRTTHYADGTPIYHYKDWWATYPNHITIDNLTNLDMYTYFEEEEGYDYYDWINRYGLLYNYYTYFGDKEVCMTGWEVPSAEDWNVTNQTKWRIADELFLTAGGMGDSAASMLYDDNNYGYWGTDNNATTLPENIPAIRMDSYMDDWGHEVVNGYVRILDVTSIRCVKIDYTLVVRYNFEGNLQDSSYYGRNLTEEGGITYSEGDFENNISGQAAWFDGVDTLTYYEPTGEDNITLTDNFTIAFWVRPDLSLMDMYDSVMSTSTSPSVVGSLQIDYDGTGKMRVIVNGGSTITIDIEDGEWSHWAVTKINDGDSSSDNYHKLSVYKNGVFQTSTPSVETTWDIIKIGMNRNGGGHWKGYIDDFRVYQRTLIESEIKKIKDE